MNNFLLINQLNVWHVIWSRLKNCSTLKTLSSFTSVFLFLFISSSSIGSGLDSAKAVSEAPLFSADDPLEMTLVIDMRHMMKDDAEEPEYTEGQLILHQENEADQNFSIKVRPRGYSRRFFDFCNFPPLKLNFKKKEVKGTVFDGQDKLKMVSYCKDIDLHEDYILKEYLIYKMYNCITPYSFKVRLIKINYKDINDKGREITRYGFLIEDDDIMAARNGGIVSEALISTHDRCERSALDAFTLFQFMIGNTDWWIARPKQHNIKLVVLDKGAMIPVPYDFDYCGLVNAKYAVPPESLPISNVTDRYFRGYCRLPGTYETIIDRYNERKDKIYQTVNDFDLLREGQRKTIVHYLDQFYDIVNNPKALKRKIYNNCELQHNHLHLARKTK